MTYVLVDTSGWELLERLLFGAESMEAPLPNTTLDIADAADELARSVQEQRQHLRGFVLAHQERMGALELGLLSRVQTVLELLEGDEAQQLQEQERRALELEQNAQRLAEGEATLASRSSALANQEQELNRRQDELAAERSKALDARDRLRHECAVFQDEKAALEQEKAVLESQRQELLQQRALVAEQQAALGENREAWSKGAAQWAADRQMLESLRETTDRERRDFMAQCQETHAALQREINVLRADKEAAARHSEALQQRALALEKELARRGSGEASVGKIADRAAQLEEKAGRLEEKAAQLADKNAQLERELGARADEAGAARGAAAQLQQQVDAARRESAETQQKLHVSLQELAQAKEQLAAGAATASGIAGPPDPSGLWEQLVDMQRRYEMSLEDIKTQRARCAELETKLARARAASPAGADKGGGTDWESQKRRLLASLEADFNDEENAEERLTIEAAVRKTDEALATKDRELAEMQRLMEEQSANWGSMAVGASAVAQILDKNEVVRQERENLIALQNEWRDKLRQAEVDLSQERAKMARDQMILEERTRELENRAKQLPAPVAQTGDKKNQKAKGNWLARLGLKKEE